jgi:hypothetical protein
MTAILAFYAALTWKQRDNVHADIPAVKARYGRQVASVK